MFRYVHAVVRHALRDPRDLCGEEQQPLLCAGSPARRGDAHSPKSPDAAGKSLAARSVYVQFHGASLRLRSTLSFSYPGRIRIVATIAELIAEWTGAGGQHVPFRQTPDLIIPAIATDPQWASVNKGVCFAASCLFISMRANGRTPVEIVNQLRNGPQGLAICQKQNLFSHSKDVGEKFAIAGRTVERKFDSGVTPRPKELTSREKVLDQLWSPGLYIFESFGGHLGHNLAFDTRRPPDNVFFFDANHGIFHARSFAQFREWFVRYMEGVHEDGTSYKKSQRGGSRRLMSYT